MTFDQVVSALRQIRPEAELGLTAQRGKYYDQAVRMIFSRRNELEYVAVGPLGKVMWLYFNERLGRICCGTKG